ncbi:hypothetical protein TeGR_g7438 [Tetraparma gracilis]|uniref:Aminotransferase class V domain-containing protein n=1 Tax=Tetraparma gracilis TaxID=2962635 RepID=A0ABQ6N4Q0_9STRA|nr:hypothetical protein TeGR_g7438 [Tetraparma gracilis]
MLSEFMLDPGYLNLNHGSFGSTPRPVISAQQSYVEQCEARPDIWYRKEYKTLLAEAREATAKLVGADPDNLVLLENASAAVNGIFRSLSLEPGDIFIYFSTAYAMVKHTAGFLSLDRGIKIIEVPITLPIGTAEESFVAPMRDALAALSDDEKARVRMVTLSHISSVPAFEEPVKELADVIKASNPETLVLVDGAHALGQIPIDIGSLGDIDYYLSNAHKWLFTPKAAAFLWTRSDRIEEYRPQPTVISSENNVLAGIEYTARYAYTGTKDFTSYIAVKDAISYRKTLGGEEAIMEYTTGLARQAGDLLVAKWGTARLSDSSFEANLFNVILPTDDFALAQAMQEALLETDGIYMLALQDAASGIVYTRLSSQVYLELGDFDAVGDKVLAFLNKS